MAFRMLEGYKSYKDKTFDDRCYDVLFFILFSLWAPKPVHRRFKPTGYGNADEINEQKNDYSLS